MQRPERLHSSWSFRAGFCCEIPYFSVDQSRFLHLHYILYCRSEQVSTLTFHTSRSFRPGFYTYIPYFTVGQSRFLHLHSILHGRLEQVKFYSQIPHFTVVQSKFLHSDSILHSVGQNRPQGQDYFITSLLSSQLDLIRGQS